MGTEHKAGEELAKNNGYAIVANLAQQHGNYQPLQTEMKGFEKAVKLKSRKFVPQNNQRANIRDKLDSSTIRFLSAGTICKKYGDKGKAKKKKLNMRSVKGVVQGAQANGMQKCNPANSFVIISIDPNGREFRMGMECKTNMEMQKWVQGVQQLIQAASQ